MKRLIALAAIVAAMATAALVGGVSVAQATPTCSYGTGSMAAPAVLSDGQYQDVNWEAAAGTQIKNISCNFNWNVRIQLQNKQSGTWGNTSSCNGSCSLHLPTSGGCNGGDDVCAGGVASFGPIEFQKSCGINPPYDTAYRAHLVIYDASGNPVDDYYTNPAGLGANGNPNC